MSEPSEKDSGALRARARERIEQGRLPRSRAVRTWGGLGSGSRCDLCDGAIASDEPEFELQLEGNPAGEPLRFHRLCHALWNEAREACEPGGWRSVDLELPPSGIVVEARVSLGGNRSIIINVICQVPEGEGEAGASASPTWLNETTGGPLPDGWVPIEWRPAPSAGLSSDSGSSSSATPTSSSGSRSGAAA